MFVVTSPTSNPAAMYTLQYLKIRHVLDVMHCEKNLCENILRTLFGMNDSPGSRQDVQDLNIRPEMSRTSPKGCPKHQGHKGDPIVTPGTCGAGGEKAQVILVWVGAPGVGNASHPWRLGVMRERP